MSEHSDKVDELVRVENYNIINIARTFKKYAVKDYGVYEAIEFFESYPHIDWHDLEKLLANGCEFSLAMEILV